MKLCAAVLFLTTATALAQTPEQATEAVLRTHSTAVLVPALVRNADGSPVFTLTASDFRLTDDGVEQKLTLDDDTGGEPLALVVAVETGGSAARRIESYRGLGAAIAAFVGNVPHRVAVVGFDGSPKLLQDFTPDLDETTEVLKDLEPGDKNTAILDALAFSVDQLRRQPPNYRRAILLLSETLDNGSQAHLEDALRAVSDTNTAIYSLSFSSTRSRAGHEASQTLSSKTPGPPGGCMAKDPNAEEQKNRLAQAYDCLSLLAPPLRLAKVAALATVDSLRRNVPETVARLTGGEYLRAENDKALTAGLLTYGNHLPNRYLLSFQPQSPHPGFHVLELRLRDYPNLRLAARSGYWADSVSTGTSQP